MAKTNPTTPSAAEPSSGVTAHPRLLALSALVYAAWLCFLAYVAWKSQS